MRITRATVALAALMAAILVGSGVIGWRVSPAFRRRLAPNGSVASAVVPDSGPIRLVFAGDTLVHRPFDDNAAASRSLVELIRGATLAFTNLENNLLGNTPARATSVDEGPRWVFGGEREARALSHMGFDAISLANNHATDYGPAGLSSTCEMLQSAGLAHVGVGDDLVQARAPVVFGDTQRVAYIGVAVSSSPDSRATGSRGDIRGRPGVSPLRYTAEVTADPQTFANLRQSLLLLNRAPPPGDSLLTVSGTRIIRGERTEVTFEVDDGDERDLLDAVRFARATADVVVVSIHAHEPSNGSDAPPEFLRRVAHRLVDAGSHVVVGHGPHRLRGLELYGEGVIFYSLGNFLYQTDQLDFRAADRFDSGHDLFLAAGGASTVPVASPLDDQAWWQTVVPSVEFLNGRVQAVRLMPVDIDRRPGATNGLPAEANAETATRVMMRLQAMSVPFGTTITHADHGWVAEKLTAPR